MSSDPSDLPPPPASGFAAPTPDASQAVEADLDTAGFDMADLGEDAPGGDGFHALTDSVLAGELVIGLLEPAALARAEARAVADAAFAREAAAWARRLYAFIEEAAPAEPSPAVWQAVSHRAGLAGRPDAAPQSLALRAANDAGVAPAPSRRTLAAWRVAAAAGFALAAASLVALVFVGGRASSPSPSPLLATRLMSAPGESVLKAEPQFVATVDGTRRAVVLSPLNAGPQDGRARELWLIPKGGKPIAVGVIDLARSRALPLSPTLVRLAAVGATLAVSLEPQGGSPTGAPTGPVIATGVLAAV